KRSRLIIWTGFACNVVMALVFSAVVALPYPEFWKGQGAYAAVLGMTPRLVAASLAAYFLGEFSNAVVMSKMKLLTGGRWLFSRTIGSTLVGEGIDTAIFITGAFYGLVPNAVLFQMVITQYVWKVVYEALATPLTYALVGWVKRKENLDTFDRGVRYNPFGFGV
ncbi:MAG: queuosine precursor transporter, partial [Firmicutes bacterium]|nr:queuosine precursor transporter [Bacillota bacterium]